MDNDFDNADNEIKSSSPVINSSASDSADTEYAGESKGTLALALAITGLCAPVAEVVSFYVAGRMGIDSMTYLVPCLIIIIAPFISAASLTLVVLANKESKRTGKPVAGKIDGAMLLGFLAMFVSLLIAALALAIIYAFAAHPPS